MVRLASVFVKAVLQGVVGMDWRCGWDAVGRRDGRRVRAHRVGRTFVLYSVGADVTSPKLERRTERFGAVWSWGSGGRQPHAGHLVDELQAEPKRGPDGVSAIQLSPMIRVETDSDHGRRAGDGDEHEPSRLVLARVWSGDAGDADAEVCL